MSKKLVKKSLHKFLNDNLSTYVTYNSNESDLTDISQLHSTVDITYTAPTKVKTIIINQNSYLFQTDLNLVGKILTLPDYGLSDTILTWNNLTSTIVLTTGFAQDVLATDEITILDESLIYMETPFGANRRNSKYAMMGHSDMWYLYIKQKDDSNKDKTDDIIQAIEDLIYSNKGNFIIYDTNLTTPLGYGSIEGQNLKGDKIVDINGNLQSVRLNFVVNYFMKY